MMNGKIYQEIFDELSKYLVPEWEKMVIYLEYGNKSYSFSFYVKNKHEYLKCYDIPGVTENSLSASFSKIDKILAKERLKEKKSLWTNMTVIVDPDGKMHADIDYTDLSDGTYKFKKEWKKKYLA